MRKIIVKIINTERVVGELTFDEGVYSFEYASEYMNSKDKLSISWDLPLKEGKITSKSLFDGFNERIADRGTKVFKDKCYAWGVNPETADLFELLGTVGREHQSSFVFWDSDRSYEDDFDLRAKASADFYVNIKNIIWAGKPSWLHPVRKGMVIFHNISGEPYSEVTGLEVFVGDSETNTVFIYKIKDSELYRVSRYDNALREKLIASLETTKENLQNAIKNVLGVRE